MLRNFRLRTIIVMVSGLIGLSGLALVVLLAFTIDNVRSIEEGWFTYQSDRSEKARLESVLRASIGYGGMIHEFKNYVLRHEEFRMDLVQADIGAARAVIGQYRSLGLSEAEKVALEDISGVLKKYDEAVLKTRDLIKQNTTTKNIDDQVRIDDSIALRSLRTLRSEVIRLSGAGTEKRRVKGRIVANIRAGMGYGGMIHEFKNLVLRSDLPRVGKVRRLINDIENSIKAYRDVGQTTAEKIALDDIENIVAKYKSKLDDVSQLITTGASIAEIDKAVKINDTSALRGLKTLDKEIAFQVDTLSSNLGRDLTFLATVVPIFNWLVLGMIVLAMGASVWFFQIYVVRPISSATDLMNRLAKDETEITIDGMDRKNEIGQMARALETFRKNIIGRIAAEAEIRSMAHTDSLTGLDNRKRFDERLVEAVNMAKRTGSNVACLMIDLDKFKPVNDTFGHIAGDTVLKAVGERLSQISRDTDFVARLGGDEFAMIATVLDDAGNAELPAKRIIDQLGLPVYFEDNDIKIGGSVGIAVFPKDADNAEDLHRLADEALYAAKNAGRNTYRFSGAATSEAAE
ncbi:MAG: diguanylate cyclase [Rhodospirillaceae bacterium]|nr:diguanylate cyclase [Rhodospirillaceae bacterium]MBT3886083.1 diguanylate cyclase [Rhodospirillaceae bacterium]MBT4116756.1 diguanylate cyclase [Rhodospirillaceae bacterium]MBT4719121.1 diguanylate cyclase [Rhodospirillaceae bacterium]MBT4748807.1 diguanylate cyclase [Rhodospirillaceae bacterium]